MMKVIPETRETGEDFISLQLVSYLFVLFCMTIKYKCMLKVKKRFMHTKLEVKLEDTKEVSIRA